jgi:hypothetical protein
MVRHGFLEVKKMKMKKIVLSILLLGSFIALFGQNPHVSSYVLTEEIRAKTDTLELDSITIANSDFIVSGTSKFGTISTGLWNGTQIGNSYLDADLSAIAGLSSTGMIARTGSGTASVRTLTGTSNEITVTNGLGVAGNPTFSLPTALTFTGKTITGGTFNGTFNGTIGATTPAAGTFSKITTAAEVSGGIDFGEGWSSYASTTNDVFYVTHLSTGGFEFELRNVDGTVANSRATFGGNVRVTPLVTSSVNEIVTVGTTGQLAKASFAAGTVDADKLIIGKDETSGALETYTAQSIADLAVLNEDIQGVMQEVTGSTSATESFDFTVENNAVYELWEIQFTDASNYKVRKEQVFTPGTTASSFTLIISQVAGTSVNKSPSRPSADTITIAYSGLSANSKTIRLILKKITAL